MDVRRIAALVMAVVTVVGSATLTSPVETAAAAAPRTAVGPGGTGILHVTPDGRFASVIANTGTAWGRLDMTTGALVTFPVSRGFLTADGTTVIGRRGESQVVRRVIATGVERVWTPHPPGDFLLTEITGASGNGRYVGFTASSGQLADVAGFVLDTTSGAITRLDTFTTPSLGGNLQGNGSGRVMPSSNGGVWAFEFRDGPVGCTTCLDVWVATPSGYLELASPATDGGRSDTGNSRLLDISGNGRWVLFGSNATDLQGGAAGAAGRLYVRDMTLNTIRVLPPIEGLQWGDRAAISDDGQRVLMSVERETWLSPDPQPVPALHDATTGETLLIVPDDALIGDTLWVHSDVDLSASGTRLAYTMAGLGGPQSFRTDLGRATGEYVGIVPQRVLDTRTGARRSAGSVTEVLVGSSAGVPLNARAASLTVTAVSPSGSGWVTAYPCGSPRPNASTLNVANATMANSTIVKLPATGKVCLYTSTSTHLLVDVGGYFPASSTYTSIAPVRRYDSRSGTRPAAGQTVQVLVAGTPGIPAGARAASLNLTITGAQGSGYATAYPCGTARPATSSINFGTGWTVANATITQLPANGRVCIYLSRSAHVLVDVNGALPSTSSYRSVTPARFYDSRPAVQRPAGSTTEVQITGRGGVPVGATAVSLNVTTSGPNGAGYLTVFPCGPRPLSSLANFNAGWTIANGALLRLPSNGKVCLFTSATTDLLVDVNGYMP